MKNFMTMFAAVAMLMVASTAHATNFATFRTFAFSAPVFTTAHVAVAVPSFALTPTVQVVNSVDPCVQASVSAVAVEAAPVAFGVPVRTFGLFNVATPVVSVNRFAVVNRVRVVNHARRFAVVRARRVVEVRGPFGLTRVRFVR